MQGVLCLMRICREYVERRATKPAGNQRFHESLLVDDLAARGVDQQRALLHTHYRLLVDQRLGVRCKWAMQADDIRVAQHFVDIPYLRYAPWQHLIRGRGMVNQNLDVKWCDQFSCPPGDAPVSDQTKSLASQLRTAVPRFVKHTAAQLSVLLGNTTQQGEQQSHGMLGDN